MSSISRVVIVGVGLIGGSIGLALRQRGLADEIVGVGRRQTTLDKAQAIGAVTRSTTQLKDAVGEADLVIVATPVSRIVDDVAQILDQAPEHTLVTDVGSTKSKICAGADALGAGAPRFVGSHPLAGDHRSGPEYARADLFEAKTVVLTPTATTSNSTTKIVGDFWSSLGAEVVEMTPEEHDQALAFTSHLPHLVASVLAESTPTEWLSLAGTGWSDTTRIAASDPELWTQIFDQNRSGMLVALKQIMANLEDMQECLQNQDWPQLHQYLAEAKRTRDALGN